MKKYLLGLFAIVMAIGLNSFTTHHVSKIDSRFTDYFWYEVNSSGVTTGNELNSVAKSKTYALDHLTTCTDVANKNYCILGSTTSNLMIGSTISSPASDAIIRKTN